MMVRVLFCIILFFLPNPSFAFGDPPERQLARADSLFKQNKAEEARQLFGQAFDAFERAGDRGGMFRVKMTLGNAYTHALRMDEALEAYREAMALARAAKSDDDYYLALDAATTILLMRGDLGAGLPMLREKTNISAKKQDNPRYRDGHATNLAELGHAFVQTGRLDSALILLETALEIKKTLNNQRGINRCLNYLGLYHSRLGDSEKALDYYLQAVEGAKLLADTAIISTNLGNVASVFIELKNWPKAEQYAGEAYQLAAQKGYKTKKADASVNLARLRLQAGDRVGALTRYEEAIELYRAAQNRIHLVECLLASARIQQMLGRAKPAEDQLREALHWAETSKDLLKIAAAQCAYGNYFLQNAQSAGMIAGHPATKNATQNALQWLEKATATATRAGAKDLQQDVWRALAEAHERAGNPARALFFHKRYAALKDSLLGAGQQNAMFALETRYRVSEKEKQIALLDAQNEVKNLRLAQSQRRQWFLLLGLAAAALLAFFAFYTARVRQDANRKLAEKNEIVSKALGEKELLLREIHHRVKNNLQVISGLLKLQSKHLSDGKALDALREGRNRVQSMALIHQNLYQEDNLTGIAAPEYIGRLADALFQSYNTAPDRVELKADIAPLRLDVDTAIPLGLILNELLSNALKHAFPEGQAGRIDVSLQQQGESLQLRVADNGVGMPAKADKKQSFGFQLIELLAEKLKAQLSFSGERGATVELNIQNFKLT